MYRLLVPLLLSAFALSAAAQAPVPGPKVDGDGFFGVRIANVGKLVMITHVYKNTSASTYKARPGDLILRIGGKPVESTQKMIDTVTTKKAGTVVKFVFLRGAEEVSVDVKLGKRPTPEEELPITLKPLEEERKAFLTSVGMTADGQAKVHVRGLTALRAGEFERAGLYLAVVRAMARGERDLAAKEARAGLQPAVDTAEWLCKMAALGVKIPENLGRVNADDGGLGKRAEALVKQLADRKYKIREQATKQLVDIGEPAIPALTRVVDSDDLEQRSRAKRIIAAIQAKLEVKGPDWGPAVYRVVAAKDGSWTLERVIGPALTPRATYEAIVGSKGETRGKAVSFAVSADDALKVEPKSGAALAAGQVLVFLAPSRKAVE